MLSIRKSYAILLLGSALGSLLAYWAWLLYKAGTWQPINDVWPDVGGLMRYLLGIVVVLATLVAVAEANYRLAFQRWLLRQETQWYYWVWQCLLAWLAFEALQWRTGHDPDFVDENIVVTGVLLAFIVAYGYVADSFRTRRERIQLRQQKTEAELTALKAQINPHFLFNALNTIYNEALLADNERVADLIQQLAGIMRFTLQEARHPLISIDTELRFLEKYLALQRARLPQTSPIRLDTQLDWDGQEAQIAPLLLIPFVENAFQYGISLVRPSYINLDLRVENRQLCLELANSCPPVQVDKRGMGTGIINARQRLALIYPARHALTIRQTTDSFIVSLTLDLN
ncbi:sensor histidine kinase [Spirosoma sordidisoli]|uniref:Histidine kinase n=1 Tax=Spirosoma sordidisoli TaxID=2502893 RepID=A0A4Q2UPM4_9BACT|nr:histidine kinase [Spirosoma sordidisoli]RYC68769.1 histidine kinase [Spirosoma sordidisoli]